MNNLKSMGSRSSSVCLLRCEDFSFCVWNWREVLKIALWFLCWFWTVFSQFVVHQEDQRNFINTEVTMKPFLRVLYCRFLMIGSRVHDSDVGFNDKSWTGRELWVLQTVSTCSLPSRAGCGMWRSPPPVSSWCSAEFHALEAVSQYLFSRPAALSLSIQSPLLDFVAACGTAALWHATSVPNPFPMKFNTFFKIWKVHV